MNKVLRLTALVVFTLALTSLAQAQATRTWVSGVGDDANPCSRTAPCKTFAGAISKTASGGEISVLDPGGFGAVTITKSITLDGTGTLAGILNSLVNGVIINANVVNVTDTITLRGLSINGALNGLNGVRVLAAEKVNIEDTTINGNTGHGIDIAEADAVDVNVRNVVARNNTLSGISVQTNAGLARVSIINSSFVSNGNGIHAKKNSRVSAILSNFSANSGIGVFAEGNGGIAAANVSNSLIANNGTGVQGGGAAATTTSAVRINNNDILQNNGNGALVSTNGAVETFSNNRILGNGTNLCPSCTPVGFN